MYEKTTKNCINTKDSKIKIVFKNKYLARNRRGVKCTIVKLEFVITARDRIGRDNSVNHF